MHGACYYVTVMATTKTKKTTTRTCYDGYSPLRVASYWLCKEDNFLKICSFTKHLLITLTNFVFFLPGLNYKYPADNTRHGLNAHMQFIASDATLQIGVGDTRGLPASLIVTRSPAM
jgi:hypothetical protein